MKTKSFNKTLSWGETRGLNLEDAVGSAAPSEPGDARDNASLAETVPLVHIDTARSEPMETRDFAPPLFQADSQKERLEALVQTEIEDCQTTEIEDSQTLLSQPIVCGDVSFAHDKCFIVEETGPSRSAPSFQALQPIAETRPEIIYTPGPKSEIIYTPSPKPEINYTPSPKLFTLDGPIAGRDLQGIIPRPPHQVPPFFRAVPMSQPLTADMTLRAPFRPQHGFAPLGLQSGETRIAQQTSLSTSLDIATVDTPSPSSTREGLYRY